jgi:hypothetical protein
VAWHAVHVLVHDRAPGTTAQHRPRAEPAAAQFGSHIQYVWKYCMVLLCV